MKHWHKHRLLFSFDVCIYQSHLENCNTNNLLGILPIFFFLVYSLVLFLLDTNEMKKLYLKHKTAFLCVNDRQTERTFPLSCSLLSLVIDRTVATQTYPRHSPWNVWLRYLTWRKGLWYVIKMWVLRWGYCLGYLGGPM